MSKLVVNIIVATLVEAGAVVGLALHSVRAVFAGRCGDGLG